MKIRRAVLLSLVAALVVPAGASYSAQAATYAQIEGSGSTWSETLMQQWVVNADADGMKVAYSGGGSLQGRRAFDQNVTDFGVIDIPPHHTDESGAVEPPGGRELAYVPLISGGLAFTYHLRVDGERIADLDLSSETIAKIFTNQITRWDDPAIARDNRGRTLPSIPIVPVVRSDGSGTTAAFTSWLDRTHPVIWRSFFGAAGSTAYFPRRDHAVAAAGSDQVMNSVVSTFGNGRIGFVEDFYPANRRFPVAAVQNAAGNYMVPNAHTVWTALRQAPVRDDGSVDLESGPFDAPHAYPIPVVAHAVVPTGANDQRMTTAKRQTVTDFLFNSLCEGQRWARIYGYSPVPVNLVRAGLAQLSSVAAADPGVDVTGRNISSCRNPTFDPTTSADVPPGHPTVTAGKPVINGVPRIGSTLSAALPSYYTGASYDYTWNRNGQPIPGATGTAYVPQATDVDTLLSVTVTPHQHGKVSIADTSDAVRVVGDPVAGPVAEAVAGPIAVGRPTVKVTKAPTRKRAGKVRLRIKPSSGSTRINGRTPTILTLRLGGRTVTRKSTVALRNGVATVTVPRLPKKGRWSARVTVLRSDLVATTVRSSSFSVKVAK